MEKDRNKKLVIIVALAVVCSLTIGFAAFSGTLNIASNASVSPNSDTFGVKFSTKQDSLEEAAVKTSSASTGVTGTDGVIDNSTSPTLTNLSATFTTPGQYVEYTVYARNEGKYKAYLNNVNFIGEKTCTAGSGATASLVEAACRSINMTVTVGEETYNTTTAITGHALDPDKGEKVVVRLSYDSDGTRADGSFSIKLGDVTMVYSTIDDSTYVPPTPPENTKTLNYIMKNAAQSDAGMDFSQAPTTGVYTVNSTMSDTNPIYYYRGEVTNNNVLFANKCWKVVRTTETGGVKLIYNGTPTNGQCLGNDPTIGTSKYGTELFKNARYIYENGMPSAIKEAIDTWYRTNMTPYTVMLEDTAWCMDLSVYKTNSDGTIYYGAYGRTWLTNPPVPSVSCPTEYQLKVSASTIGNKLDYPIALLTADEIQLAGSGPGAGFLPMAYLNIGVEYWLLSPRSVNTQSSIAEVHMMNSYGYLSVAQTTSSIPLGVRPAISLAPNTEIADTGDGTKENPYIVR